MTCPICQGIGFKDGKFCICIGPPQGVEKDDSFNDLFSEQATTDFLKDIFGMTDKGREK